MTITVHTVLLIGLSLIGLTSAPARAETLLIVADPWCPYNCAPDSPKPGMIVEIVKKAFERHGISVTYETLPWTRAVEETRAGHYNAIIGALHGDAPDFVFPDKPQAISLMSFFVKAGTEWRYTGMESLNDISLGCIADYSYSTELDSYIRANRRDMRRVQPISGENALEINLQKLAIGRIDAFVEEENVMLYHLSSHDAHDGVVLAGSLPLTKDQGLFAAFSPALPSSKKYADILSRETQAMTKDGTIALIMQSYGLAKDKTHSPLKP